MFSLENGEMTGNIDLDKNGFAWACKSGFASNQSGEFVCSPAPAIGAKAPFVCDTCSPSSGNIEVDCQCSYDGKRYCPLLPGDVQVQKMISAWPALFEASKSNCNGLGRYSYECFYAIGGQAYVDYLVWAVQATLFLDGNWYKAANAPEAVLSTFLLKYTNINKDYTLLINKYSKCPVYQPKRDQTDMADKCMIYSANIYSDAFYEIYQVNPCSTNVCQFVNKEYGICRYNFTGRYPGDYCVSGSNCLSNSCLENRCAGLEAGENCSDENLCDVGLYCNLTFKCESVNNDVSCSSSDQCNSSATCVLGNCVMKFSLGYGETTQVSSGNEFGYSEACKEGFAYVDEEIGTAVCSTPPISPSNSFPIYCNVGITCADSTGKYLNPCSCGYGGFGYCPLYFGDFGYLVMAISHLKKIMGKISCFNNVFTDLCVMYDSSLLYDYYMYYVNMKKLTNLADFYYANADVMQIYEAEFYAAVNYINDHDSSSSFALGLLFSSIGCLF